MIPPERINPAQIWLRGKAWTKHLLYYYEDGSLTLLVRGDILPVAIVTDLRDPRLKTPRSAFKRLFSSDAHGTG